MFFSNIFVTYYCAAVLWHVAQTSYFVSASCFNKKSVKIFRVHIDDNWFRCA